MRMSQFFSHLLDRLAAGLAGAVAGRFEAAALNDHAEVLETLHERADRFEQRGLHEEATRLRERIAALSLSEPAALGQAALQSLPDGTPANDMPALPEPSESAPRKRAPKQRRRQK